MPRLLAPRIVADSTVCGGRPTVAGTRVRVSDVVDMLAGGASEAEIVADYPYLELEDVRACPAFAARSTDYSACASLASLNAV